MIDINIVNIINDKKTQTVFYNDLKKIYKYSKDSKNYKIYLAIDFEYNTKKIALMQMMFEIRYKSIKELKRLFKHDSFLNLSNKSSNNDIILNKIIQKYYIIYPPNLNDKLSIFLKKNILANKNILKILHGAESLDIPYIIYDLYQLDMKLIVKFILSMIDTRYLCEFLNISLNKKNICSLYDMLLNFNIINSNIKNKLDKNENIMGPIYDIFIDINTLNKELIIYSIHDVVFLINAYKNLKYNIIQYDKNIYKLLIDVIRYSYLEKKNITNVGDNITILNNMNNYFIYAKQKINLIKIYKIIFDKYRKKNPYIDIILNINYLKTNLIILFKNVIYNIIYNNFKIYSSNNSFNKYNIKDNYNSIITYLNYLKLNHLSNFLENLYTYVNNIITNNYI